MLKTILILIVIFFISCHNLNEDEPQVRATLNKQAATKVIISVKRASAYLWKFHVDLKDTSFVLRIADGIKPYKKLDWVIKSFIIAGYDVTLDTTNMKQDWRN